MILLSCKAAHYNAGISCMFASTHSDTDEQTAKLLKAHQSAATATASSTGKPTEVQAAATAAADATVHSEVPAGPTVELADKTAHGTDEMPGKADQAAVSAQISGTQGQIATLLSMHALQHCMQSILTRQLPIC